MNQVLLAYATEGKIKTFTSDRDFIFELINDFTKESDDKIIEFLKNTKCYLPANAKQMIEYFISDKLDKVKSLEYKPLFDQYEILSIDQIAGYSLSQINHFWNLI